MADIWLVRSERDYEGERFISAHRTQAGAVAAVVADYAEYPSRNQPLEWLQDPTLPLAVGETLEAVWKYNNGKDYASEAYTVIWVQVDD